MKGNDKLLLGIVGGIVLLIVIAFVVTLSKPEAAYQSEDTPEGVVHNYLLALQKADNQRAYSYLSKNLEGYPRSLAEFSEDIDHNPFAGYFDEVSSFSIDSATIYGEHATVTVKESVLGGGLWGGQNFQIYGVEVEQVDGDWKIIDSDHHLLWCWKVKQGCN